MTSVASIGPVTQSFIDALGQGQPLTNACICDFGLDSGVPFGRLNPILFGLYLRGWTYRLFTAEELDKALGKGPALTELLRRVDPSVTIKCVYDAMTANDLEEEKG